ncbi:MAG: citrate lyase acyl carrier protein [Clostridia bacterium]
MKVIKTTVAGTLESNDALITLEPPKAQGLEVVIDSIVEKQFGSAIRKCITDVLSEHGISDAFVHVRDKGALDCTLKARMETAILRLKEET